MNKKKQKKQSKKTTQEKILTVVFFLLLILVIILSIIVIKSNNENIDNTKVHVAIPVIEENSYNELSIDISNMKVNKENEYVFKIVNYKRKDINKKELTYNMTFTKPSTTTIKIYKNNNDANLLTNNNLELLNNKLNKNKKQDDIYHLIITNTKTVDKDSKITIKIES